MLVWFHEGKGYACVFLRGKGYAWFREGKGYQNRSGNLSGNLCGNLCGILLQAITWVLSVFVCLFFVSLSCSMHEDTLVYIYMSP